MPPQSKKKRKIDEFGVPENVPAFLRKTWAILYTPAYSDIVYWGSNGTTIVIDKVTRFSSEVLPAFFKHSNYASFVRQLNMYGFYKVSPDPACREFKHKLFRKDRPDLLTYIKRKSSSNMKSEPAPEVDTRAQEEEENGHYDPEEESTEIVLKNGRQSIDGLLDEMVSLKQRQRDLERELQKFQNHDAEIQRENSQLWEELQRSRARQTYMRSKMQRLVAIMYEMYKALSMTNQIANSNKTSIHGENENAIEQRPANSSSTQDFNQNEVVQQIFSSDGILSPEQFARMLEYLNIGSTETLSFGSGGPAETNSQENQVYLLKDRAADRPSSTENRYASAGEANVGTSAAGFTNQTPPFSPYGATTTTSFSTGPFSSCSPKNPRKREPAREPTSRNGDNPVSTGSGRQVASSYRPGSPSKDTSSSGSEGVGSHSEKRPIKQARKQGHLQPFNSSNWSQDSLPLLSTEQEQLADAEHTTMSNIYGLEHSLQNSYPQAYSNIKDNVDTDGSFKHNSPLNDDDERSLDARSSIFGSVDDFNNGGFVSPGGNSWAAIGQSEFGLNDLDEMQ